MRLFLSSYRAGKFPDKFIEFFGKGSKVAVITNAKDYKSVKGRKIRVDELMSFFRLLGFEPTEIDLRKYFGKPGAAIRQISRYDVVWMAGGNVFLLRRALNQAGIFESLAELVRKNKITYGGESAGAIIAGPTLKGSEDDSSHEDGSHYVPRSYEKPVLWDGFGFINFVPVPHYKTEGLEESIDGYVRYVKQHRLPHITLREDQVLIVDGSKTEILK